MEICSETETMCQTDSRVYEALWNAGGSGAGAVPTDMQARKLPVSAGAGKQTPGTGTGKPSAREAAAKIFCASALRDMELEVDDVRLTQLPDGHARMEVWLTVQDEKQALEVRI